ncbi:MAG: 2-oxoacid:acceptor oxidoreductase family protein [bacterium]
MTPPRRRASSPAAPARTEVRFAGYGGQGIALMGLLAGKAAALHDGKHAVFTQSYGPEARGGASSANVVVSPEEIDYPLLTKADVLVAMFQEACDRYLPELKSGGVLLYDADLVKPRPGKYDAKAVPATRIAEGLGRKIVANMVMLGAFSAATGLVSARALEEAVKTTVKPKTVELNLKALAQGAAAAASTAGARV